MAETLMQWWPLAIGGAILWAGYTISTAINAASNRQGGQFSDIKALLLEMRTELKWTNDSVKRVEQRLPPPPENFG